MITIIEILFQNLADSSSKACFCGGLGNFYETLPSVESLLCETQGSNNQDRTGAGRLFFAGESKEWSWSGGWWDTKPSTTSSSQSSGSSQDTTDDTLKAEVEALSANKETVSDVSTKVAAITGSSGHRAAATTCADFITLVIKCKFGKS